MASRCRSLLSKIRIVFRKASRQPSTSPTNPTDAAEVNTSCLVSSRRKATPCRCCSGYPNRKRFKVFKRRWRAWRFPVGGCMPLSRIRRDDIPSPSLNVFPSEKDYNKAQIHLKIEDLNKLKGGTRCIECKRVFHSLNEEIIITPPPACKCVSVFSERCEEISKVGIGTCKCGCDVYSLEYQRSQSSLSQDSGYSSVKSSSTDIQVKVDVQECQKECQDIINSFCIEGGDEQELESDLEDSFEPLADDGVFSICDLLSNFELSGYKSMEDRATLDGVSRDSVESLPLAPPLDVSQSESFTYWDVLCETQSHIKTMWDDNVGMFWKKNSTVQSRATENVQGNNCTPASLYSHVYSGAPDVLASPTLSPKLPFFVHDPNSPCSSNESRHLPETLLKAIANYRPNNEWETSLAVNDILVLLSDNYQGWYLAENCTSKLTGYVPSNYTINLTSCQISPSVKVSYC